MAIAVFDYDVWAARYPELAAKVSSALAASYFAEAGLYLDNTDGSIVADVNIRLLLLNMLVAHIAALNVARADPSFFGAGRVSSATEGSVSVALDVGALPGSAAWYGQTTYGFSYWAATAGLRTMQYIPGPQPYLGAYPYAGRGLGVF